MDPEDNVTPEAQQLQMGTPEYDAAMVAKFDETSTSDDTGTSEQTGTQSEDRPSWLPEKFNSAEDLAKAYAELEKKQSSGTADEDAGAESGTADEARQIVTDAGLDFDALSAKFATTGELSEEDYAALEGAKIPRAMVDAYIEGQQAIAASHRATLLATVGGEEGFVAASTWAAENLDAADIDAFNAVMDGGDMGAMKLALAGLKAQYEQAGGAEPSLLGGSTDASSGDVFRSTAELTTAMRDPRYAKDPAYRADVEAKLGRSKIF